MEEQKPKKKREFHIGYKKLKNVDLYEDFEGTAAPEVNEGTEVSFSSDLADISMDVNALHRLDDEGFLDDHGYLKEDIDPKDAVADIEENMGANFGEVWDSHGGYGAWLEALKESMIEFANKY